MQFPQRMIFTNLKPSISDAIKESCYRTDARIYNIANEVHHITTFSVQPGVEIADGLSKIIDKTIQESVGVGCDMSVIVKGILLGAFRASPFIREEAHKTIRILIDEILQSIVKYKGDVKQTIEGILTAIVTIAREFKLNVQEALIVAREDILFCAKSKSIQFADEVKAALPDLDNP